MVLDNGTRRQFLSVAAGSIIVGSAGCLDEVEGGETEFTIASATDQGESVYHAGELFEERIAEESDGDLSAEFVGGGAYGSEPESADLLSEGSIEMYTGGSDPFDLWASDYYFFNDPFFLEDFEHTLRIMESEEFQSAHDQIAEYNIQIVGERMYRGNRLFTANEPVEEPEDVDGMDLRLPEEESWIAIWEAIGASPTAVSLDELYSALQQGVVDASEGPAAQILGQGLHEVQDYLSITNHLPQNGSMYINTDFYESLDDSHQDIIDEVSDEVTAEATEWGAEQEEDLIDELEDEGMEVVDDVNFDAFEELASPVIDELFESQYNGDRQEWEEV